MSPAEIIILVTRVLVMCGLAGAQEDEAREFEVALLKPPGSTEVYDVMIPRGSMWLSDTTVVLAGNQE